RSLTTVRQKAPTGFGMTTVAMRTVVTECCGFVSRPEDRRRARSFDKLTGVSWPDTKALRGGKDDFNEICAQIQRVGCGACFRCGGARRGLSVCACGEWAGRGEGGDGVGASWRESERSD